ncbi:MAG: tRNA uridine-5-carboxymethylaminomethyl(34) synthesis GTPase MnmE, partial [Clostridia bacterium]|nr:tRNA uridine-5-carboxymethylaminomethyl(34) synthesis GTPase MnmE [Clostridia bacterium]
MMILGDTIAAVSTPRGKGGVALLRISGPRAIDVAERVFVPKNGRPLSDASSRVAVYGSILSVEADGTGSEVDDGIATVFRSPASFTGEDTVEIACHGGIHLTETVLTSILAAGARGAEAGEFTRR